VQKTHEEIKMRFKGKLSSSELYDVLKGYDLLPLPE